MRTFNVWLSAAAFVFSSLVNADVNPFAGALLADRRHESVPAEADIYAPFLGRWQLDATEYPEAGGTRKTKIELTVARILDGRAVQDVWVWPGDLKSSASGANRRTGTTLRVYDPVKKLWHVTWISPSENGRVDLDASREGANIVQVGTAPDGSKLRWTFTDITPHSFTWRGEASTDNGRTWRLYGEYFGTRP